jgi:aminopeptidase N
LRVTVAVDDLPAGETVVAPGAIPTAGPSYMPAFAVGDYTRHSLGVTAAGTEVLVWSLPGGEALALGGTSDLVATLDFYERTYGPYPFGPSAGAVPVDWGPTSGGIESHPYWHVAARDAGDGLLHAHEAAHGWFGNGVRLRCWEDFALSEGLATYLAARAVEAVDGTAKGAAVWTDYSTRLDQAIAEGDTVAWPAGCNAIALADHPLYSWIPYLKGALFLRAVESGTGRAQLDASLCAGSAGPIASR